MNESPTILDLRDAVTPEPVSMAPATWGWFVLFGALLAIGIALAVVLVRRRRANRYRRAALVELESTRDVSSIAALVKRVCLAAYPRAEVASLTGEAWLRFLDGTTGRATFTHGPGRRIADHYGDPDGDVAELKPLVRDWIRRHRARA